MFLGLGLAAVAVPAAAAHPPPGMQRVPTGYLVPFQPAEADTAGRWVRAFWLDERPVTNAEFARTLGKVLRRPAAFPVPRLGLVLLYGEMAKGTILSSHRASPDALTRAGFVSDEPHLDGALRHELSRYDADAR